MKSTLNWDQYFLSMAKLSGMRSKDPNTKVGACIVNSDNKVVGLGYNGMPYGFHDEDAPWKREGEFEETKYAYVVHAELNAILNSTSDLKGSSIYVSLFPCNECSKAIVQSGIREVVYANEKYKGTPADNVSRIILKNAGVKLRKIKDVEISIEK